MSKERLAWLAGALACAGMVCVPVTWAQDNVDGPWGTAFGNLYRTGSSADLPVTFSPGTGAEVAWTFDPALAGAGMPEAGTWIVFDSAGNLYWRSADYFGAWNKVVSLDPDGNYRWVSPVGGMGAGSSFTGPIVGQERVYALGHLIAGQGQAVYAYDKDYGDVLWETFLNYEPPGFPQPGNHQPAPVLYNGKLYVFGIVAGDGVAFYQIDAATGNLDWGGTPPLIVELTYKMSPAATFVPDMFGAGEHGIYVVEWDVNPAEVNCIKIDTNSNTAVFMWDEQIGPNPWWSRTHLIYNEDTNRIYAYSFQDGNEDEVFSFNPLSGADGATYGNAPGDHGNYMNAALDFDARRLFTGGPDGRFYAYEDDGTGNLTFVEDYQFLSWWGTPRLFCQLLQDDSGNTIALTSTNAVENDPELTATVTMIDVSDAPEAGLDGPTYIDDIQVWQGPDVNNLTLVWEEDFNAYTEGQLSTQSAWVDVTGGGEEPVWVRDDPTGSGQGTVLELDVVGNIYSENHHHGAWHDHAQTTGDVLVAQYKQWREHVTENTTTMFGDAPRDSSRGHANAWDISRTICALGWVGVWESPVQSAGVWQNVTFTYDFVARTSTIDLDGEAYTVNWEDDQGVTRPEAPTDKFTGFQITLQGTEASDAPSANIWFQHRTGSHSGYLGAHLRGGPVVGPDGKIYYFNGTDHPSMAGWLVALGPGRVLGDLNCSGALDAFDIDPFVLALTDPVGYAQQYPDCDRMLGDINGDGNVDAFDIDPFVELLVGP